MRQILQKMAVAIASIALAGISASRAVFDFSATGQASADLDGVLGGTTISDSLILSADANGDTFHLDTGKGFGIENGSNNLKPYEFNLNEIMSMSFPVDVLFQSITMVEFQGTENAYLDIPGLATITMTTPTYTFAANTLLPAGQVADFGLASGNGFGLETLVVTAVPEPSSLALLLVCTLSLHHLRGRRG